PARDGKDSSAVNKSSLASSRLYTWPKAAVIPEQICSFFFKASKRLGQLGSRSAMALYTRRSVYTRSKSAATPFGPTLLEVSLAATSVLLGVSMNLAPSTILALSVNLAPSSIFGLSTNLAPSSNLELSTSRAPSITLADSEK